MVRAGKDKRQLAEWERTQAGQGAQLPANVHAARDRIDTHLKAAIAAMQKRDNDQTEQSLQSLENDLAVIETFLKQ